MNLSTFSYDTLVTLAQDAGGEEDGAVWKQADIALEVSRRAPRGQRLAALRGFCADVGPRYKPSTLARYATVAEAFPECTRVQSPVLTFRHFWAIAMYAPDQAAEWLEYATDNELSARELENEIRGLARDAGKRIDLLLGDGTLTMTDDGHLLLDGLPLENVLADAGALDIPIHYHVSQAVNTAAPAPVPQEAAMIEIPEAVPHDAP